MVRIAGIPGKHGRHAAARHARADHVGHVRRLLGVQREAIVDRHVGRNDQRVAGHDVVADVDERRHDALEMVRVAVAVDVAAGAAHRRRQRAQVLERMELSLPRKAQAGAGIPARVRRARLQRDVLQPGAMRGIELALERRALVALGEEQIAVEA